MKPRFHPLNAGWNAEPYTPNPLIEVQGRDLVLRFLVNAFQFAEFEEGESGALRFVGCERYRLGPTNDDGWYGGQCRFSRLAPDWGEFYLVQGDAALLGAPQDWQTLAPAGGGQRAAADRQDAARHTARRTPTRRAYPETLVPIAIDPRQSAGWLPVPGGIAARPQ